MLDLKKNVDILRSGLYTLKNCVEFLQDRFNMIEYSQYTARMHYKQALKMANA